MEKKRYRSFNSYLRELFHGRVQRVPLDAGLGCPHRKSLVEGGCIYCGPYGSGTGKSFQSVPISQQMREGMQAVKKRYRAAYAIAYFQSYTNTNASISLLRSLIDEAVSFDEVVGLFVSTRPDCLNKEVVELLCEYKGRYLTWLELGLQSIHQETLNLINRGHGLEEFEEGFMLARSYGLPVCTHIIMGLPNETEEMMLGTVEYLARIKTDGIKIHNLCVLEGTRLWEMLKDGLYRPLDQETYVDLVIKALELLPPDTVIMRLTGDPPPKTLFEPQWASEKGKTLQKIEYGLKSLDTYQGKKWKA
ncbi:MAG: TIGR01212 family radical SAM protein [Desulfatiglandales bacterium]